MITWTMLKKESTWGIRSEAELVPGSTVRVARKNGSLAPVVVGRLVWKGNGVFLYTVSRAEERAEDSLPARRARKDYSVGAPKEEPKVEERLQEEEDYGAEVRDGEDDVY